MLRNRFLIMLGVCFLAATAAWADDVGYVDCNSHSEGAQLFGKPRKTPDTIGTLPCGERFTILVYGFFFSRVETKDGQIGFVYSSVIAVDRAATAAPQPAQPAPQQPARQLGQPSGQQATSLTMAAEKTKIPRTPPMDPPAAPAAQPQAAAAQQAVASAPIQTGASASVASTSDASKTTISEAAAAAAPSPAVEPQVVAQPATTVQTAAPTVTSQTSDSTVATTNVAEPAAIAAQPTAPATAQPEPAPAEAQPPTPQPAPAAQPTPAAPPAIRPADARTSWERPLPSAHKAPLLEFYGGYAFARMGGTGSSGSNLNGALGSVGWNAKTWLQVVGDSSYSMTTISGTKNVLYGNHFGARLVYRGRNRWGLTPFVEGLVGGSSLKTTVSGTGGYTSSTGSALSYKAGGGIDIHPSKRWEIRLIDVDYYRTTFAGSTQQNNYWFSTGVVLRLFGGGYE